jgi:hypothetical protein
MSKRKLKNIDDESSSDIFERPLPVTDCVTSQFFKKKRGGRKKSPEELAVIYVLREEFRVQATKDLQEHHGRKPTSKELNEYLDFYVAQQYENGRVEKALQDILNEKLAEVSNKFN